jgi:hypothetical protein
VIELAGLGVASARVLGEDGTLAGRIVSSWPRLALPAGKYLVEFSGQRMPVELAEGAKVVLKLNQNAR